MNSWESFMPDIEIRLKELFGKIDSKKKKKFISLWAKLDPVDRIYYQYCEDEEERYRYYVERYMANKKFQDRIEEIFEAEVYDIDAKNTLEMWRLLDHEMIMADNPSPSAKMKMKVQNWQRNSILKRLQKYARDGVQIQEKKAEEYLELLAEQKKRQKLILKAEEQVPAELLVYFDEYRETLKEMGERCLVLQYCMDHLGHFGLEKEEEVFWKQLMLRTVTECPETMLEDIRRLMHEIE